MYELVVSIFGSNFPSKAWTLSLIRHRACKVFFNEKIEPLRKCEIHDLKSSISAEVLFPFFLSINKAEV